jgi:hypothetical protein
MVYNTELLGFWTSFIIWYSNGTVSVAFPRECGRSYTGETGRSLAMQLREHRHNLKDGLLVKSKLAQHAYEENHRVGWDDAKILETESNSKFKKYWESAYIHSMLNQFDQPTQFGHISHLDPPYQQ